MPNCKSCNSPQISLWQILSKVLFQIICFLHFFLTIKKAKNAYRLPNELGSCLKEVDNSFAQKMRFICRFFQYYHDLSQKWQWFYPINLDHLPMCVQIHRFLACNYSCDVLTLVTFNQNSSKSIELRLANSRRCKSTFILIHFSRIRVLVHASFVAAKNYLCLKYDTLFRVVLVLRTYLHH